MTPDELSQYLYERTRTFLPRAVLEALCELINKIRAGRA